MDQVGFDRQYDSSNSGLIPNHDTDLIHLAQKNDAIESHHGALKPRNVHEGMRQIFERDHGDQLTLQNQSQYNQQLQGMCGRQIADPKHNQSNIFDRDFHNDRLFVGNNRHLDYERPVLMKKPMMNECKEYQVRSTDRQYGTQHGHPDAFGHQTRHHIPCDLPTIQRNFDRLPHPEGISDSSALSYQQLQTNQLQISSDKLREKAAVTTLQPSNRDQLNIRDDEVISRERHIRGDEDSRFFTNGSADMNNRTYPDGKTERSNHMTQPECQPKSPEFHKHHLKFRNNPYGVQSPEKVLNTHVRTPDLFTPEHDFSEGYEDGPMELNDDNSGEEIISSTQPQIQSPGEGLGLIQPMNSVSKDEMLDHHEPARTYETQLLPETIDKRVSLKIRIKTHSEYFKQESTSSTLPQSLKELPGSTNSNLSDLDDAVS